MTRSTAPSVSTPEADAPQVRPGQVWADNDRREQGRTVEVVEVTDRGGVAVAHVKVLTERGGDAVDPPRYTRIQVRRLRPTSTGYRLVRDVPAADTIGDEATS